MPKMSKKEKYVPAEHQDVLESEEDIKKRLELSVITIKRWLKKQKHLPSSVDDKLLYHIAANTKGDNDRACRKLDAYYTVRTLIPEFFSRRDPSGEDIKLISECVGVSVLSRCTPNGYKVLSVSFLHDDATQFNLRGTWRRFFMIIDQYFLQGNLKPGQGVYIVSDCLGIGIDHVKKLSPILIRKGLFCLQSVYPLSIKGIIFVNLGEIMRVAINTLVIPVLSSKLKKRVHAFGSHYEGLYDLVPKDMLPLELGGSAGSYRELSETTYQELISKRTWFLTNGCDKSNEEPRDGKCPISAPGCCLM